MASGVSSPRRSSGSRAIPATRKSLIRFGVILVAPGKVPRHVANPFDATH